MHSFLTNNRDAIIARCKEKVAERPRRAATYEQLNNGIPLVLEQLTRTLQAQEDGGGLERLRISAASGGDTSLLSQVGVTATAHGKALLALGYTVDQVVHDYGDLCQAIRDFAAERHAPFSIDEVRTLNRCLDNAIADAVASFSAERERSLTAQHSTEANQRLGVLARELRNAIATASLAVTALEIGDLSVSGATGGVLKRSLAALSALIDRSASEVRISNSATAQGEIFSVAALVADARDGALLDAKTRGSAFKVPEVDPALGIQGNRGALLAAIANLVQNALKFTHPHTEITLHAYAAGDRVQFDVKDNCGGLSPGDAERMFLPFSQRSGNKVGLGLGLSIAKGSVEADGGALTVRDVPDVGCVFTMSLPRYALKKAKDLDDRTILAFGDPHLAQHIALSAKGKLDAFDRLYSATAHVVLAEMRKIGMTDVEKEMERIYLGLWPLLAGYRKRDDANSWLSTTLRTLMGAG